MDEAERAEVEKMVTKASEGIETKLAKSMAEAMEGINKKIDAMTTIAGGFKTSLDGLPTLVRQEAENQLKANLPGIIENQLKANITGIVEEVGKQFEAKMTEKLGGGGNSGGGVSNPIGYILDHADQAVSLLNAWRQPTTEVAMLSQMNFVMKWHSVLSKLEKGGGSSDDVSKAIASTFIKEE